MADKVDVKSHKTSDGLTIVEEGDTTPTYMKHPDIDGIAGPVARWTFDGLWKHKGWVLSEAPSEEEAVAPAMVSDDSSTVEPDDGA